MFIFQGFSHPIKTNGSGAALVDYLILDTDGRSWELKPTYRFTRTELIFLVIPHNRMGFLMAIYCYSQSIVVMKKTLVDEID